MSNTQSLREPFPQYPPPLTSRPEGLLSLLGLQQNGKYPQHLETNTLGVGLDLLRWYCETQATFKTGTIATAAAAGFTSVANLTVPAGEHWLLLQFNAIADQGVFRGWLMRTNSSGGSAVTLSETENTIAGQAAHLRMSDTTGQFYLARPSVQLGIYQDSATARTFGYTLRYVRLFT